MQFTDEWLVPTVEPLLREAVAAYDWPSLCPGVVVSLSAGVAEMHGGLTRSSLVNAADRKLYEAKNAGRNLVFS